MPKKERSVPAKPTTTKIRPDDEHQGALILKLHEGSRVRLRDGRFHFDPRGLRGEDRDLLRRAKLEEHEVAHGVAELNALLAPHTTFRVDRLFGRDERVLEGEKAAAEESRAEEIGDPNLYYALASDRVAVAEAEELLDSLNRLAVVELAYPQPKSRPASSVSTPATPDFSGSQGYLGPAPGGVDARYAWSLPGGKGEGIRVIDVEYA